MIIAEGKNIIHLSGFEIPFRISKGKAHRVRLSFDKNTLTIETGTGSLGNFEKDFLKSKSQWILKSWELVNREESRKDAFLSKLEEQVMILGKEIPVTWQPAPKTWFRYIKHQTFQVHAPDKYLRLDRRILLYHSLRKFAEAFLKQKVDKWAESCELDYNTVRVKDHRSKWGSCSSKRNINLNWHLIFLKEELVDYVIVHELMHLREMNHSPRFWNWVGKYLPDYQRSRNDLKQYRWLIGILQSDA